MNPKNALQAKCFEFRKQKYDSYDALKFVMELFVGDIYPFMKIVAKKIHMVKENNKLEETLVRTRNVFILCSDQIKKCFISFLDIIRTENKDGVYIPDSRHCILERVSWCYQRLLAVEEQVDKNINNDDSTSDYSDDSLLLDSMYFVNWVDQTFEILSKMSSLVYKTNQEVELVECVCGLHKSIDELLLSAMTLCRYCLPSDQVVVKARCQVVLRETKALLGDLIIGDLDSVFQATIDNLKLPIMPFNVSVLIDVLKDVLYALETNTNTALLALLVHTFSQNASPAEMLKQHLNEGRCSCVADDDDVDEKCNFVKAFDMYNERLSQIGTFAMSCSCDESRILGLRSGLASLEALDPHLVPALMLSPISHHSTMLLNIWHEEVKHIRDNVFLIVDPAAFSEKTKQMMQDKLLELMKEERYDNDKSCAVINIGYLVYEFFDVYNNHEPEALPQNEKLQSLLDNLYKEDRLLAFSKLFQFPQTTAAQIECKTVSDSLCSDGDFMYNKRKKNINVSLNKFLKRLQLLFTLVKRIFLIFNPKENDDEFYNDEQIENRNNTYTLDAKKQNTYCVDSPRNPINITKSIFARTNNARCTPRKLPLAILTRHLKTKTDLSFSIKLDDMCNLSEIKKTRESSILYHPQVKTRSLRKAVLNKHLLAENLGLNKEVLDYTRTVNKDSFMDETMSLQITDVLNQLNDLTTSMALSTRRPFNSTSILDKEDKVTITASEKCHTSVNKDGDSMNISAPSDVNTLDRINDMDLVESKLSELKFGHIETSL